MRVVEGSPLFHACGTRFILDGFLCVLAQLGVRSPIFDVW